MRRPLHIWIIFALCLAVVLSAVAWISLTALQLDRKALRHAALEENVRLALWRMESALAPIITQESARPYFAYSSFYSAERAYTHMFVEIGQGEVLVPSPLLTHPSSYVLLHFQFPPDGELTSPQAPTGNMRDKAEASYTTHGQIEASTARLAQLRGILSREKLLAALPEDVATLFPVPDVPSFVRSDRASAGLDEQALRNDAEWQARAANQMALRVNTGPSFFVGSSDVRVGVMKALWFGSAVTLARRVSVNGEEYVQGCWLDWPAIRRWLARSVKDLLKDCHLEPAGSESAYQEERMLAALPVRLVPGQIPVSLLSRRSSIAMPLLIAWGSLALAAVAVAVLLRGAVSLSERRGAFVSSVTHELRTPLTTLQMYTEMLADGIVSDREKVRRYLDTLRVESKRLGHLVENVLAYARLEGRGSTARREMVKLGELIDRLKGRLAQRAEQSGMRLIEESEDEVLSTRLRSDTAALEHILFNLVDNACKYADSAPDRIIHLTASREGKSVLLRVRDHGPGINKREARRLFRPFCKSASDAANSVPGVGLGLALSRRLARGMGGDLRLDENVNDGACFVLTLPIADSAASQH